MKYHEKDVAKAFGLSRGKLNDLKTLLIEGEHYKKDGRQYEWLECGIDALKSLTGVKVCMDMPDKKKRAPASNMAEICTVHRIFSLNTKIIEVETEDGDYKRVRVRNSEMFVKGQEIPVFFQPGVAVGLIACRHPTVKGRLKW